MNAIISLCHFCELHGPAILFCTQAFHSFEPDEEDLDHVEDDELRPTAAEKLTHSSTKCTNWLLPKENNWQLRSGSSTSTSCSAPTSPVSVDKSKVQDFCEACRSFESSQGGFVSNDEETSVSYISSQHPRHPEVFSMVRQACVRSLSCEICPGREGPIFFGDEHRSQVLSHTFVIKDSLARGLQRSYSIIIVMTDKIFLLNSWPFLVKHIRLIIDQLKAKATAVFDEECQKFPARNRPPVSAITPGTFRNTRGGCKPARSLVELTNDRLVFKQLHTAFTWMLKAGANRLMERLLEGPPTEGFILDMDQQEETEEGFIKLYSKSGMQIERTKEWTADVIGFQQEYGDASSMAVFTRLRSLLKVLGYSRFHILAHHVVIGNQLIVRSYNNRLAASVIDCLKTLIPKGCCRIIYNSEEYVESYKCNFLGLPPSVEIEDRAKLGVILDISEQLGRSPVPDCSETLSYCGVPEDQLDLTDLAMLHYNVKSLMPLPDKGPTVLEKMEKILLSETLADSVTEHCLVCLKEEWMNKVKVLFQFTKVGSARSTDETDKLWQVIGARDEDKMLLKYWMSGLSVSYHSNDLEKRPSNETEKSITDSVME